MTAKFANFREFYAFYLGEHSNAQTRRLHFIGTASVLALVLAALITGRWGLFWFIPIVGYGFAWVGHIAFEKNRPATFRHPLYSLVGDFVMFRDMLVGRIKF